MSQENMLSRSPGIRVSADGTRIGAVYGIGCPALEAEGLDTTPLNSAWRTQRPSGKRAGDLTLTMLLKRGDAGQAALIEKYLSSQDISIVLTLPDPRTGEADTLQMTVLSLDAELLSVDGEGRPSACRDVTAVLRER